MTLLFEGDIWIAHPSCTKRLQDDAPTWHLYHLTVFDTWNAPPPAMQDPRVAFFVHVQDIPDANMLASAFNFSPLEEALAPVLAPVLPAPDSCTAFHPHNRPLSQGQGYGVPNKAAGNPPGIVIHPTLRQGACLQSLSAHGLLALRQRFKAAAHQQAALYADHIQRIQAT